MTKKPVKRPAALADYPLPASLLKPIRAVTRDAKRESEAKKAAADRAKRLAKR